MFNSIENALLHIDRRLFTCIEEFNLDLRELKVTYKTEGEFDIDTMFDNAPYDIVRDHFVRTGWCTKVWNEKPRREAMERAKANKQGRVLYTANALKKDLKKWERRDGNIFNLTSFNTEKVYGLYCQATENELDDKDRKVEFKYHAERLQVVTVTSALMEIIYDEEIIKTKLMEYIKNMGSEYKTVFGSNEEAMDKVYLLESATGALPCGAKIPLEGFRRVINTNLASIASFFAYAIHDEKSFNSALYMLSNGEATGAEIPDCNALFPKGVTHLNSRKEESRNYLLQKNNKDEDGAQFVENVIRPLNRMAAFLNDFDKTIKEKATARFHEKERLIHLLFRTLASDVVEIYNHIGCNPYCTGTDTCQKRHPWLFDMLKTQKKMNPVPLLLEYVMLAIRHEQIEMNLSRLYNTGKRLRDGKLYHQNWKDRNGIRGEDGEYLRVYTRCIRYVFRLEGATIKDDEGHQKPNVLWMTLPQVVKVILLEMQDPWSTQGLNEDYLRVEWLPEFPPLGKNEHVELIEGLEEKSATSGRKRSSAAKKKTAKDTEVKETAPAPEENAAFAHPGAEDTITTEDPPPPTEEPPPSDETKTAETPPPPAGLLGLLMKALTAPSPATHGDHGATPQTIAAATVPEDEDPLTFPNEDEMDFNMGGGTDFYDAEDGGGKPPAVEKGATETKDDDASKASKASSVTEETTKKMQEAAAGTPITETVEKTVEDKHQGITLVEQTDKDKDQEKSVEEITWLAADKDHENMVFMAELKSARGRIAVLEKQLENQKELLQKEMQQLQKEKQQLQKDKLLLQKQKREASAVEAARLRSPPTGGVKPKHEITVHDDFVEASHSVLKLIDTGGEAVELDYPYLLESIKNVSLLVAVFLKLQQNLLASNKSLTIDRDEELNTILLELQNMQFQMSKGEEADKTQGKLKMHYKEEHLDDHARLLDKMDQYIDNFLGTMFNKNVQLRKGPTTFSVAERTEAAVDFHRSTMCDDHGRRCIWTEEMDTEAPTKKDNQQQENVYLTPKKTGSKKRKHDDNKTTESETSKRKSEEKAEKQQKKNTPKKKKAEKEQKKNTPKKTEAPAETRTTRKRSPAAAKKLF
jgi:hypothetical protein